MGAGRKAEVEEGVTAGAAGEAELATATVAPRGTEATAAPLGDTGEGLVSFLWAASFSRFLAHKRLSSWHMNA